jgi:hypothetical protein
MALIERGRWIQEQWYGWTALYWACNGHTEIAKLLMMNGADRINPTDLAAARRVYEEALAAGRGRSQ